MSVINFISFRYFCTLHNCLGVCIGFIEVVCPVIPSIASARLRWGGLLRGFGLHDGRRLFFMPFSTKNLPGRNKKGATSQAVPFLL